MTAGDTVRADKMAVFVTQAIRGQGVKLKSVCLPLTSGLSLRMKEDTKFTLGCLAIFAGVASLLYFLVPVLIPHFIGG